VTDPESPTDKGDNMKWKIEERFMVEQFGAQYVQYQGEVNAVIPGLL
jgi:protein-S-isoprenylcysteine O-methyltransferase Ste14